MKKSNTDTDKIRPLNINLNWKNKLPTDVIFDYVKTLGKTFTANQVANKFGIPLQSARKHLRKIVEYEMISEFQDMYFLVDENKVNKLIYFANAKENNVIGLAKFGNKKTKYGFYYSLDTNPNRVPYPHYSLREAYQILSKCDVHNRVEHTEMRNFDKAKSSIEFYEKGIKERLDNEITKRRKCNLSV